MFNAFAHSEWISANWPKRAIVPNTLTAGSTINTYSASPQPAASIDAWDAGALYPQGAVVLIDVASVSGTGTLTVSLRDCKTALTSANGDANSVLAATLATISAAGLYYAEFPFSHVFASTLARVVADSDYASVMRYHSLRAVAASADFVFSAMLIYFNNLKGFPSSDATLKAVTWAAT